MSHRLIFCVCFVAMAFCPAAVPAATLEFIRPIQADYEFSVQPNIPGFNPGPTPTPFIPFRAVGDLTFELDPSLNDAGKPTSVPFLNVTGTLNGVAPSPVLPYTLSPDLEFVGGDLTDIVRDGSGEVLSANVVNLSMRWILKGQEGFDGLVLYTKVGLPFNVEDVTIPFGLGTVLAGPLPFEVFLDDGDNDPGNDLLFAVGQNRTLTVVPEPGTMTLFSLGAMGLIGYGVRRRRS